MSSIWNENLSHSAGKASSICWLINAYDEGCQYLLKQNKHKDMNKWQPVHFLYSLILLYPYILADTVIAVFDSFYKFWLEIPGPVSED